MRSLRLRLNIGLLISLFAGFIVLWLIVSNASRVLAEDYITTRLTHDSETLLTATTFDSLGKLSIDSSRLDPIYKRPFSGHYFIILSDTTRLRSRSLWDQDLTVPVPKTGESLTQHLVGPQQQPLLILTQSFQKSGHTLTITIAEDMTSIERNLARIQQHFALTAVIVLLLLMIVQGAILYAGLRPLDNTRNELRALAQGRISHLTPRVPSEIAPLVHEFNHLIDVLAQRLTRSRHALGDLAHALKKPLTVLTQLARDQALENHPQLKTTFTQQLDNIQQHTTRILQRARLAGTGPTGSIFIADQEIPFLLTTLQAMYRHKQIHFDIHIPADTRIAADREDMLELIGNLLDNACKWAHQTICLSIDNNQHTRITVEDDGSGVPQAELERLTQRGVRMDETTEGHGLGLAIANDIVNSLGGEIHFDRSQGLGGLRVTITLPQLHKVLR